MAWYIICETATGKIISQGTVLAGTLDAAWEVVELADKPPKGQMWDAATKTFIARPATVFIDRLQDILTNPAYSGFLEAYNALSAARKTAVRNGLAQLLGPKRWRHESETVELD